MKMAHWKRFADDERLALFRKNQYMLNKYLDTTHTYRLENKDAVNNLEEANRKLL